MQPRQAGVINSSSNRKAMQSAEHGLIISSDRHEDVSGVVQFGTEETPLTDRYKIGRLRLVVLRHESDLPPPSPHLSPIAR